MAKDRHRIFEIYTSYDEAAWELMPKTSKPGTDVAPLDTSDFKHIVVSRLVGITQVRYKEPALTTQEMITEAQNEFVQLADKLGTGSKVLIDFTGVKSFGPAEINALAVFNRRLQVRGSRMVLCCLDPEVRASFFATV